MANSVSYSVFLKDHMSKGLFDIARTGQTTFDKLDDSQERFQRELKETKREAGGLNSVLQGIGQAAVGYFAIDSIVNFGMGIVDVTSQFEKFQAVLTNTFGSELLANKSMKMLEDFATKTPFQLDQLMGGFVKLANQGFAPTEVEMRKLGDLAASTGKDFDMLSEALLDAQTGEFERLKEFGIKGSTNRDGTVSFRFKGDTTKIENTEAAIRAYILSLGDAQGVAGSMAAVSATLGGQISNLEDNFTGLQKIIGESSGGIFSFLIAGANSAISFFKGLFEEGNLLTSSLLTLGGAVLAGVIAFEGFTIISTISKLMKSGAAATWLMTTAQSALNFVMSMNPIGLVIGGIAALTAGVLIAWNEFEGFRQFLFSLWETVKQVFSNIGNFFKGIFSPIIQALATFQDDSLSIFEKTKKIGGNMVEMAFNLSPVGMAKNMYDFAKDGGLTKGVADAWQEGQRKGTESWEKDQKKEAAGKNGLIPAGPTDVNGVPIPPVPPTGGGSASALATATGSSSAGGSGGGSNRNLTINIESLIKDLTISTTNMQESAGKIQDMINEALIKSIRDFEVSY